VPFGRKELNMVSRLELNIYQIGLSLATPQSNSLYFCS